MLSNHGIISSILRDNRGKRYEARRGFARCAGQRGREGGGGEKRRERTVEGTMREEEEEGGGVRNGRDTPGTGYRDRARDRYRVARTGAGGGGEGGEEETLHGQTGLSINRGLDYQFLRS